MAAQRHRGHPWSFCHQPHRPGAPSELFLTHCTTRRRDPNSPPWCHRQEGQPRDQKCLNSGWREDSRGQQPRPDWLGHQHGPQNTRGWEKGHTGLPTRQLTRRLSGPALPPTPRFPGDPKMAPPLELPLRCLIPSTRQGLSAPATQLRPHSGAGDLAHPYPLQATSCRRHLAANSSRFTPGPSRHAQPGTQRSFLSGQQIAYGIARRLSGAGGGGRAPLSLHARAPRPAPGEQMAPGGCRPTSPADTDHVSRN